MKNILLLLMMTGMILPGCKGQQNKQRTKIEKTGKVVGITDGDTFEWWSGQEKLKVRLWGIDCPERRQPFYQKAKEELGKLCFQKNVRLVVKDKDRYGRIVALAYTQNGKSVNLEMIRRGYAWNYDKYSKDKTFIRAEKKARRAKKGLWADAHPQAPWKWRKEKRSHSKK